MDTIANELVPEKKKFGLSAAVLKWVAIILMFVNHFSTLPIYNGAVGDVLNYTQLFVTRISYPLFAFMIAEGMVHTRDRQKYMLRLLIIAIISQPLYGWALIDGPLTMRSFNAFFDLLTGALAIEVYDRFFKTNKIAFFVLLVSLCTLSMKFSFGYNILAILLTLLFYICRGKKLILSIALIVGTPIMVGAMYYIGYGYEFGRFSIGMISELFIVLCLPFVLLYNGEKGKQLPKWFFYGFYPAHLLILGLLKTFVF